MDQCRKVYHQFYNDYRRGGVSDTETYAKIDPQNPQEKGPEGQNNGGVSCLMEELMDIKLTEPKQVKKTSKKKGFTSKDDDPATQRKKLQSFMKENSNQIFAFEELLLQQYLTPDPIEWDYEEKKKEIEDKDWSGSDARSFLRVLKGRDPQTTKSKYAIAWKLLNDPLARIMVSDRFMESWHDKMFPKLVNPYKFKRMEK